MILGGTRPSGNALVAVGLLFFALVVLAFSFHGDVERVYEQVKRPSAKPVQPALPQATRPTSISTPSPKPANPKKGGETSTRRNNKLHILLPASNPEVNLCKTLLTGTVLGYPTPTLIAWNQTFDQGHLLGGGSHVAKISGVLDWLEAKPSTADDELVLMMDAYGAFDYYDKPGNIEAHMEADIWFQLRPEVLLSRYDAINAKANQRLVERLGSAVKAEGLKQTIIFGAGKRCAPNQVHTVACYPIPESPLPDDLYGPNTDTIIGRNKYTSLKQRYLNSGYIMGPVGDMRALFRRAAEKVDAIQDQIEWDNGSHGSDFMYHGSDQSIFNTILGEQEFQREVMRRRHRTTADKARGLGKPPRPYRIEGSLVQDPLNPGFTHEPMEHKEGKPDEFSIGLDYFSDLGHQTVNSEEDARWIQYDKNITEQIGHQNLFECPSRVDGRLPKDILESKEPDPSVDSGHGSWRSVSLYTNLCLNTVPVMVHHNGDKNARGFAWPNLWMQPNARRLIGKAVEKDKKAGGAFSDGHLLTWSELCPIDMEPELFRDVGEEHEG